MKAQQVNFPLDGDTVKISWRLPAKTVSSFVAPNICAYPLDLMEKGKVVE